MTACLGILGEGELCPHQATGVWVSVIVHDKMRPTHNHRRVRGIAEELHVSGFGNNVDAPELHVGSDIDIISAE
jgi:hypothetical protein